MLGAWWHERFDAELALRLPGVAGTWLDLRNRRERLERDPRSGGRICRWNDSSTLTAVRVFSALGPRLLRHALADWPVSFDAVVPATDAVPGMSIIIPIGGRERLRQFGLALAAARAQRGAAVEVVVVEQGESPALRDTLPTSVRYLFQQVPAEAAGFNKSWAVNGGARLARAAALLVLDADMILPRDFCAACLRVLAKAEAVRPARLIFNLDEAATDSLDRDRDAMRVASLESVVANAPMPVAVRTDTYWTIGGHDEAYEGWGGEDTELVDRLRTRDLCEGGWLPVLHAWHPSAPKKADGDRNRVRHAERMRVPAVSRIARLQAVGGGGATPVSWRADADADEGAPA